METEIKINSAYEEIINFLAGGITSQSLIDFQVSEMVKERADYLCEYCLISEQDTILGCAIDHIISIKHGGSSEPDNLAYCCVYCNRFKGSDIGSIILEKKEFVRY